MKLAIMLTFPEETMVDVKSGNVKSESLCKRVSENLFSIATSVAKVQAYEVRLNVKM